MERRATVVTFKNRIVTFKVLGPDRIEPGRKVVIGGVKTTGHTRIGSVLETYQCEIAEGENADALVPGSVHPISWQN
jgi:hypothetical protein